MKSNTRVAMFLLGGRKSGVFWKKPAEADPERFRAQEWLWNSFVTVGRVSTLLAVVRLSAPDLYRAFGEIRPALGMVGEFAPRGWSGICCCAPCRAYRNTYRKTLELTGKAGRVPMPGEMKQRLHRFLLDPSPGPSSVSWFKFSPQPRKSRAAEYFSGAFDVFIRLPVNEHARGRGGTASASHLQRGAGGHSSRRRRARDSIGIVSSCQNRTVNVDVENEGRPADSKACIESDSSSDQHTGGANVAKGSLAGATGAIGKRVVPQLLDSGYQVFAATRSEKQ